MYNILRYVFFFFMFQSISLSMPDLYLGLGFEFDHKFWYKTIPLICSFVPVLQPMSVVDIPFSGIIFEKSFDYFEKVSFILTISFGINYQIFQKGGRVLPNLS